MKNTSEKAVRIRGLLHARFSDDGGLIIVGVVVLILVLAAVSLELADRSVHRLHDAAMNREAIQVRLGCQSAIEYGVWQLKQDFTWRTSSEGQAYAYAGTTYTVKVQDCTLAGYEDCVIITAGAEGATHTSRIGVRMSVGSLIITDCDNHRIRKLDLNTGIITTIAGTGVGAGGGNGGPATAANLKYPFETCVNSKGEIYIADTYNQTIRKVDTAGIITKVAGQHDLTGYTGDGGPASSARLRYPNGVAVDAADNLYIADTDNHVVRRVDVVTGIITTVAGTGIGGKDGDGGPAYLAQLNNPDSVAFDSAGNYYIADTEGQRVRRVDAVTGIITTYAGRETSGSVGEGVPATEAKMANPRDVCLAPDDHLFVADTGNDIIRRVDAATQIITRVAGMRTFNGYNGDAVPATSAWLYSPSGICVSPANNLIVADTYNHRIRQVDLTTGLIETIAGTGTAGFSGDEGPGTAARLRYPENVSLGVPFLDIVPELCR